MTQEPGRKGAEPALLPKRWKGYTPPTFAKIRRSIVVPGKEPDGLHGNVTPLRLTPGAAPRSAAAANHSGRAAPIGGGGQLSAMAGHGGPGATITPSAGPTTRRRRGHYRGQRFALAYAHCPTAADAGRIAAALAEQPRLRASRQRRRPPQPWRLGAATQPRYVAGAGLSRQGPGAGRRTCQKRSTNRYYRLRPA